MGKYRGCKHYYPHKLALSFKLEMHDFRVTWTVITYSTMATLKLIFSAKCSQMKANNLKLFCPSWSVDATYQLIMYFKQYKIKQWTSLAVSRTRSFHTVPSTRSWINRIMRHSRVKVESCVHIHTCYHVFVGLTHLTCNNSYDLVVLYIYTAIPFHHS